MQYENISNKFLGDSSFSMEDFLADIDAVNLSGYIENMYFVDAYRIYYIDMGVSKRYSLFLDYYNGNLNSKLDEILPEASFPVGVNLTVSSRDIVFSQLKTVRIPFVLIQTVRLKKYYLPTALEVRVLKEYFFGYISEQSLDEW